MDCHADFQSARNDRNNATILKSPQVDSRIFTQNAQNVFSPTRRQDFNLNAASEKVDSSFSAHNATILKHSAQDSRILEIESGFFKPRKAQSPKTPQAEGFADDFLKKPAAAAPCTAIAGFVGCRAQSKGAYLAYVTADSPQQSAILAQKPTPTPEISPCDSKILDENCGLQGKSQGSYLSGSDRRDFRRSRIFR